MASFALAPNLPWATIPPSSSDPALPRRLSPHTPTSVPPTSSPSSQFPPLSPPKQPIHSSPSPSLVSPPISPPPRATTPPPSSPPRATTAPPSSPPLFSSRPFPPSPPPSGSPPVSSPTPSSPSSPTRSPPAPSPNAPASSPSNPPSSSLPPPPLAPGYTPSTPPHQPPRHSLPPWDSSPPLPLVPPTRSPLPPITHPPPLQSPFSSAAAPPSSPPPVTLDHPPPSSPPPIVVSPPSRPLPPPPLQVLPHPGNPNNNVSSLNTPSNDGGISNGGVVAISVALSFLLLSIVVGATWCMMKRKKKAAGSHEPHDMPTSMDRPPASDSALSKIQTTGSLSGNQTVNDSVYTPGEPSGQFTYEDLAKATNGFSDQNLLGSGGFGSVYKGILADGTEVAVKELKIGSAQGDREFSAEVEIISRIHHRYLVSLVGYCISENKRLLVYEYVPKNTLYFHLHESDLVLDWATRVKVAAGAARGIAYLHEDCHPRIIHRDIKSSNILLDENFEARVADFGLAKLAADVNSHITTRVMGTFGYMAPEYATTGKLTEKSDVFSFGVVLLEIVTGRKPVDVSQPSGDESLVEWARPVLTHALKTEELEGLVDPRLGPNFVASEMFRMIEAAAACIRHSAMKRPRMGQIVRSFDSMETADLTNGMRVGESETFNSTHQSSEIRLFQRMAFGSQDYSVECSTESGYGTNSGNR